MDSQIKTDPNYERVKKAIEYLMKNRQAQPTLGEIAMTVGLSEFHFQRIFKEWAGVSPKNLLHYLTLADAKARLAENSDLLSASFEVGVSGPSRLHDLFIKFEGMTPGEYKRQGQGLTVEHGLIESPFGEALIAGTKRGICHLHFVTSTREQALVDLRKRWPLSTVSQNQAKALDWGRQVFADRSSIEIFAVGTTFQLKVWEALLRIPEGAVLSYQRLAKSLEMPEASRAVGSAIARNEIGWLIPCHRVIKANGLIGEYRWGAGLKQTLLCYEAATKDSK